MHSRRQSIFINQTPENTLGAALCPSTKSDTLHYPRKRSSYSALLGQTSETIRRWFSFRIRMVSFLMSANRIAWSGRAVGLLSRQTIGSWLSRLTGPHTSDIMPRKFFCFHCSQPRGLSIRKTFPSSLLGDFEAQSSAHFTAQLGSKQSVPRLVGLCQHFIFYELVKLRKWFQRG